MNRLIAKICVGILFAGACVSAQDVQKLVEVKHIQPTQELRNLLDVLGVHMSDPVGGFVALKGTKDAVAAAEEVLHKMDVEKPVQDVEITGWLVVASPHGGDLETLPASLEPVAKQLKTVFGYSDLRLLTSFAVRTRAGSNGQASGLVGGDFYGFSTSRVDVGGDSAVRTLRLNNVRLDCHKSQIQMDLDMNDGQKVVIGKTSMAWEGGVAPLILVLSAHVVNE